MSHGDWRVGLARGTDTLKSFAAGALPRIAHVSYIENR